MDEYPPLTPPIDRGRSPPFHEMNEHPKRFENLSARLLDAESDIAKADLFSLGGTLQYGIDVLAERLAGDGIEVASCKCYQKTTTSKIAKWSMEFLKHWDSYWKTQNVRRFILITAAINITALDIREQIKSERVRFEALGLSYEVWGPEDLVKRISGNRHIAYRFLDEAWTNILCGGPPPAHQSGALPGGALSAFQIGQLHDLQGVLSGQIEQRVETAVEALKRGNLYAVEEFITELKDNVWSQLTASAQARVLRLQASLALQREDLQLTKRLADEADALFIAEPRLRAHIELRESGPDAALATLGHPSTRDGRQLQAALLLQHGDLEDAAAAIEALVVEAADDAETHRLLAFLRLTQDRRSEAFEAAARAEALAPDWLAVLRCGAVVRYASALSPSVEASWIFYPNATNPDLVKQDDQSRQALFGALNRFEQLITKQDDTHADRVWKLACLASLSDRRADAEAECRRLLDEDPGDLDAIAWAMARGYDIDRPRATAALAEIYQAGATIGQVKTYALLLLSSIDTSAAATILENDISKQSGEALAEAERWVARFRGEPSLDDEGEPGVPMDLPERMERAKASDDWTEVAELLGPLLGHERPSAVGLAVAETLAGAQQWGSLKPHIDGILRFETASAVTLAAFVVHNTGSPDELVALLERHRTAFRGGALPYDLRRLQIHAKAAMGELSQALRDIKTLASETQSSIDQLWQAQLHLTLGDTTAALPLVRDAFRSGALKPGDALGYSAAFSRTDVHFARDLWRHATGGEVRDNHIVNAMTQAFKLGLDAELAPLMPQAHARAMSDATDIWSAPIDEFAETMRGVQDQRASVFNHLRDGAVPNHVLPGVVPFNMARVYQLERPQLNARPLDVVFMRSGARPLDVQVAAPWAAWQVHLDITGLLVADQLQLLDELEALENGVMISRHLPEALHQLELDCTHHQMVRVVAAKEILSAQAGGRLKVIEVRPDDESTIVRHARQATDIPGPTLRTVEDALHDIGEIETEARGKALLSLGPVSQGTSLAPAPGSRVVFADNTLETLATSGLLAAALRCFTCEIGRADYDEIVALAAGAEEGERLADRLAKLRLRVARAIETEIYKLVAQAPRSAQAAENATTIEHCLFDLIMAPRRTNAVLWTDDRYVTGFVHTGDGIAIVGVVEVLNALVAAGRLTPEARRRKLRQLRAGGALFIPIDTDEVLDPLLAASIGPRGVIETPGLVSLRRYLSAALAWDVGLKIGVSPYESLKTHPDETEFLRSIRRLLEDCLAAVWRDPGVSIELCAARSDWLWAALRMEQCVRPLPADKPADGNESFAALLLAGLLANTNSVLLGREPWRRSRRAAYFGWVEAAAITPRSLTGNQRFFDLVTGHLKSLLLAGLDSQTRKHDPFGRDIIRRLLRSQVQQLPEFIRDQLLKDRGFTGKLGIITTRHVTCGPCRYEFQPFWRSIETTLRYGRARLRTVRGRRVRMLRDGGGVLLSGRHVARLETDLFPVLAAAPANRGSVVQAFMAALDIEPVEALAFTDRANKVLSAGALVEVLECARETSVIAAYEGVASALRTRKAFDLAVLLPPRADRLSHHLRLADAKFDAGIDVGAAWRTLQAKVGTRNAFRRLAGLPIRLAAAMTQTVGLDELGEIIKAARTPLAALQAARLCHELSASADEFDIVLRRFVEGVRDHGRLFVALLGWSEKALQADKLWWAVPVAHRLAMVWSHADRLLDILIGHGVDPTGAASYFTEQNPERPLDAVLRRDMAYSADCAAPETTLPDTLLYHGLAYLCGDQDAWAVIPEDLQPIAVHILTTIDGDVPKPAVGLHMRVPEAPDSMGTFLKASPAGLLEPALDPTANRTAALEAAFVKLEEEPDLADPWVRLAALGRPVMNAAQRSRLDAIFERVDLAAASAPAPTIKVARVIMETRRRLGGEIADEVLLGKLFALASHCRINHAGVINQEDSGPHIDAFDEVVEVMAANARSDNGTVALQRLGRSAQVVASAWPSAIPALRSMFDALVRRNDPLDSSALWSAYVTLRAWP